MVTTGSTPDDLPSRRQLTDRLLRALADNGANFRHLQQDERVTIAISFALHSESSTAASTSAQHSATAGEDSSAAQKPKTGLELDPYKLYTDIDNDGIADVFITTRSAPHGENETSRSKDVAKLKLRGDLHMRQKEYLKAIAAYEAALRTSLGSDPYSGPVVPSGIIEGSGRVFSTGPLTAKQKWLYRKLIQAQVAEGNLEKSQRLLNILSKAQKASLHKGGEKPKRVDPVETVKRTRLRSQLVLSVTKNFLDAVGSNTWTFDAFKKNVVVRYFDPDETQEEKPGKPVPNEDAAATP